MAKKKRKISIVRILIFSAVGLVFLYVLAYLGGFLGGKKPTQVATDKAKKSDIIETVSASGKIQPEIQVKVSSDVSGEIVEVLVKEGDSVVKGQLLVKIRPDNLVASVQNAQANVSSRSANLYQTQAEFSQRQSEAGRLKVEYDRAKQLYDQKVTSDADFQLARMNYEVAQQRVESALQSIEAAKYNVQSAQASLNQSSDNLSRTEIYSPVSGALSKLNVEKGEKVVGTAQMSGTEMLIIANLNTMEVQVDVNENDIVKVRTGQEVNIDVDAYPDKKIKGIVTEIANTANPTASDDAVTEFKVKIRILNESYQDLVEKNSKLSPFRPGMTASVDIITNKKTDILTVPLASVTTRPKDSKNKGAGEGTGQQTSNSTTENKDKKKEEDEKVIPLVFIYNEEEGKVKQTEIKTGISDFENIEVLEGVKEGDEIVIGPFAILSKILKDEDLVVKTENKKKDDKEK